MNMFYKKSKKLHKEYELDYLYIFYIICILIILSTVVYFVAVNNYTDDRGTFGDSFGALTSVFSGLAFAGIIVTIIMQMKELRLTREEMRLTRIEYEKSSEAQNKSQIALNNQLKSMELSSRIESLKFYIENDLGTLYSDTYVAKAIIKSLTEKIFEDDSYKEFIKPEPELLEEVFSTGTEHYIYSCINKGLGIDEIEAWVDDSETEIELEKISIQCNEEFKIYSNTSLRNKVVYFSMSDLRFYDYWTMKLYIPPSDGNTLVGKFIDIKKSDY